MQMSFSKFNPVEEIKYRVSGSQQSCTVGNDTVLFSDITKKYYRLNETGMFLLTQLNETRSVRELSKQLCDNFSGVSIETSEVIIQQFLEVLNEAALIEVESGDDL